MLYVVHSESRLIGRTVPLDDMQKKFGEESIWVWNILRVRLLIVVC